MAVWVVTLTAPGGNRVSRPIVAAFDWTAVAIMRAQYDVTEDDPTVTVEVRQRCDPDGEYEADLREAARRRHAED